ncbi:MAG: molybdenum cofactor biosynthesis protein B [Nitrososphaerota archaeon]|nr:molybdenum cofactor biosynthesis protein MoaB [Candidatus Bathyarchaeota archaeon]MDW8041121.1 molybdenum cofactor biosynthesis protein B [Nitrososphaerota archaeon]
MSESTFRHRAEAPKKLGFGVVVVSTSRYNQLKLGEKISDESGDLIEEMVKNCGYLIVFRKIVPDDKEAIAEEVKNILESDSVNVAIFCGGTGITSTDVTIETVSPFMEKTLPGFGELFRLLSYEKVGSAAILSRAFAGVAKGKAFFCIPGSPDAVKLCLEKLILPEAAHIVKHARE